MDYYYRHLGDGRCEVICTRCFETVGVASGIDAIRDLEENRGFRTFGAADGLEPVRRIEESHHCAIQRSTRSSEPQRLPTIAEKLPCLFRVTPPGTIVWIVDLVPTLIVSRMILSRCSSRLELPGMIAS